MFNIIFNILYFLAVGIGVLLSVAFVTLLERHILGYIQRRQGPNVVGFFGLLQPIADGVKLLLKETIIPRSANPIIFKFSPIFTFALSLANWVVIPFNIGWAVSDFSLAIPYILVIASLGVHSVIMAGWASNSKYAFLGALRSAAQMVSYEIAMGVMFSCIVLMVGSLNLSEIIYSQKNIWFVFLLFPLFLQFFICTLAETNRHPFDLPEAEAELVSGYNVEYSAVGFVLFFLAEYSSIILMCTLTVIMFLGGSFFIGNVWLTSFNWFNDWILLPWSFIFIALKILYFISLFVVIRATLPRYRYDQLMRLGWKIFLPMSLCILIILICVYPYLVY